MIRGLLVCCALLSGGYLYADQTTEKMKYIYFISGGRLVFQCETTEDRCGRKENGVFFASTDTGFYEWGGECLISDKYLFHSPSTPADCQLLE